MMLEAVQAPIDKVVPMVRAELFTLRFECSLCLIERLAFGDIVVPIIRRILGGWVQL